MANMEYYVHIQTDRWVEDITAGDDFLGVCDQKVCIHMCPIVKGNDLLKLRTQGKGYWKDGE